jgi:hypothetical protein
VPNEQLKQHGDGKQNASAKQQAVNDEETKLADSASFLASQPVLLAYAPFDLAEH